ARRCAILSIVVHVISFFLGGGFFVWQRSACFIAFVMGGLLLCVYERYMYVIGSVGFALCAVFDVLAVLRWITRDDEISIVTTTASLSWKTTTLNQKNRATALFCSGWPCPLFSEPSRWASVPFSPSRRSSSGSMVEAPPFPTSRSHLNPPSTSPNSFRASRKARPLSSDLHRPLRIRGRHPPLTAHCRHPRHTD
ncbi:unnamed protein product, partial [Ectocarpus sp. 12 AP-2014]